MGMSCSPETRLALRVVLPWRRGLSQMTWPSVRGASHFHDGRHTFATLMLELGEAPKVAQSILGHTKIATTLDIYSHVSLDLETKAAAKLNAVLRRGG
jgi:integrase